VIDWLFVCWFVCLFGLSVCLIMLSLISFVEEDLPAECPSPAIVGDMLLGSDLFVCVLVGLLSHVRKEFALVDLLI
jgi:hypothetical protein